MFNCVARMGWLNRMTQFKEKAGKDRENASVGAVRLSEPDGRRHPGSTRRRTCRWARTRSSTWSWRATSRRNSTTTLPSSIAAHGHGDAFFPLPEPMITGPATRVMSLRDGTKKMSKSDRLRLFAHQPDGRCRHDRAEDPQSEDRPGSASLRDKGSCRPAGGGQSRRHLRRARRRARDAVLKEYGGAQFSTSSRRSPISRSRSWRRSQRRCAACSMLMPISIRYLPTARRGRPPSPRRT